MDSDAIAGEAPVVRGPGNGRGPGTARSGRPHAPLPDHHVDLVDRAVGRGDEMDVHSVVVGALIELAGGHNVDLAGVSYPEHQVRVAQVVGPTCDGVEG